jgi:glycosyltransferase involved in cell wall biosynthesis
MVQTIPGTPGKIAVISHVLPPSPSGQGVVLYRLLRGLPPERYCLISRQNYVDSSFPDAVATRRLPSRYHYLPSVFQLPVIPKYYLGILGLCVNTPWVIYRRARQIQRILRKERSDLLIACSGDMYDLPAACLASRFLGIPFVAYMFDDYAYQWTGAFRSISVLIEKQVAKRAKATIVPNEFLGEAYKRRYGVKCTLVRNPAPLYDLDDLDKAERFFAKEKVNIVYAGAVYHANDDAMRNLVKAMNRIKSQDIQFHIYTSQTERELKERGVAGPRVIRHSHVSESEIPKVLRQADILFLPLAFKSPIPEVIRTSAPGKMGEYLSVARPIIVHAPENSFCSWFFKRHGCGVVVDQNDCGLLAEQIEVIISSKEIQKRLGERARKVGEEFFRVEESQRVFAESIESLAGWRNGNLP